jgi:hypothetical protein
MDRDEDKSASAAAPWVVAENAGPITLNTEFVVGWLDKMGPDAKVTEGVDADGNPRSYVVGRWNGRAPADEEAEAEASQGYFTLDLVSEATGAAIAGATMWDYSDETDPKWVGASDARGRLTVLNATGSSKFRILARGFAVRDLRTSEGAGLMRIEENDPAAFGGVTGGAMSAIWVSQSSGYAVQFSAFGLMRMAPSLDELARAETQQYTLAKGHWLPRSATVVWDDNGFQGLNTRPNHFRANGGRWDQPFEPFNGFRFPEPGKMFGRSLRGEEEFALLG